MTKELASAISAMQLIWEGCKQGDKPCIALLRLFDPHITPDGLWREAAEYVEVESGIIGLTVFHVQARLEGR